MPITDEYVYDKNHKNVHKRNTTIAFVFLVLTSAILFALVIWFAPSC